MPTNFFTMEQPVHTSHNEKLLATANIRSLFVRYAVPGAISLVFVGLQSIIDGIVVGNYLGADALAAVNLVFPAYTILTSLSIIIGIGTNAQSSIGFGAKDYAKVKSTMKTGFVSILSVSLLFGIILFAFASPISTFLGADSNLIDYATGYMHGLMLLVPAIVIVFFLDYILKSLGHPRFAMGVMVSTIILNIIFNILFVTQFGLGTFGVGLATGLSAFIGLSASSYIVIKQLRGNAALAKEKAYFNWRYLWRIFYNGSSEGVSEIAMGITIFVFNLTLMEYAGKEGVAAFSVINYIIFIGTSIFLGISDGIIPIISYNFGARLWNRIREVVKTGIRTNLVIGLIFIVFLWAVGQNVVSLFLNESDQAVIDMAVDGARIMSFAFLLNGFNIFSSSFFTSIDNAKLSLIIASLRGLIFILIGIYIFPQLLGLTGIWLTIPFAEVMTAIASALLLRKTLKRT